MNDIDIFLENTEENLNKVLNYLETHANLEGRVKEVKKLKNTLFENNGNFKIITKNIFNFGEHTTTIGDGIKKEYSVEVKYEYYEETYKNVVTMSIFDDRIKLKKFDKVVYIKNMSPTIDMFDIVFERFINAIYLTDNIFQRIESLCWGIDCLLTNTSTVLNKKTRYENLNYVDIVDIIVGNYKHCTMLELSYYFLNNFIKLHKHDIIYYEKR